MLKARRVVLVSVIAGLAIASLLIHLRHKQTYQSLVDVDTQNIATQFAGMGVMTKNDFLRIKTVEDEINSSGSVSDNDLDWELQLLRSHTSPGNTEELARATILSALDGLKTIPQNQENKIYVAVQPLLNGNPSYNDNLDKVRATVVMGVLRDPRAVPYLMQLRHYKPPVSVRAGEAIEAIKQHPLPVHKL